VAELQASRPAALLRALRQNAGVNASIRRTVGAELWRRRWPASIWKRLPIYGEIAVTAPDGQTFRYHARGEPLGKTLFWRGVAGFEPGSAAVFCALAARVEHFLDIGAYSGLYTLLATTVNRSCRVSCFEPVPVIRAWLYRNLELNGVADRVRIVPAAAAEHAAGSVDFFVSANVYSPGSSLLQNFGREERTAISLPTLSLDDHVAQQRLSGVGLVKIDTEGAELSVLQGARQLLTTQRPAVLCEILDPAPEHLAKIEQLLRDVRYTHAQVTEQGLLRQAHISPDPTRRLRNFLLWAEERTLPAEIKLI